MEGIKQEIPSGDDYPQVKIVLKPSPRTERAVKKQLLNYSSDHNSDHSSDHHHHHHPCPICGSSEQLNACHKMSPVQLDLFQNLTLTSTASGGGGGGLGGGSVGGDSTGGEGGGGLTLLDQEEDVKHFICQKCMDKFEMLESLQNGIALLEKKMEEILCQLRKTISDRRPVISQEAENDKDQDDEVRWKPVILNFKNDLPPDEGEEDPLGGVDMDSKQLIKKRPRRSKLRPTQVIYDVLSNDDNVDANGNEEYYSPKNASHTDSDVTNKRKVGMNIRNKNHKHKGARVPSTPSTKVQKQNGKSICAVCGKQVVHLRQHMKTHRSATERLSCETCHKTFSTLEEAFAHRKAVHLHLRHMCEKCGKAFYLPTELKRHLNMRIPCTELLERKKFICPICKGGFSSRKHLRYHTRLIHDGGTRIKCPKPKCTSKFYSEANLQHHLRYHHPQEEVEAFDKTICTICKQKFSTVLQKIAHIRTSHSCKFCDKSFPNKEEADEHKKTHAGDRPFVCTKCGDTFKLPNRLKTHLLTVCNPDKAEMERIILLKRKRHEEWFAENKSSQIKCDFCLKTYLSQDRLSRHISKCHPNVNNV